MCDNLKNKQTSKQKCFKATQLELTLPVGMLNVARHVSSIKQSMLGCDACLQLSRAPLAACASSYLSSCKLHIFKLYPRTKR